MLRGTFSRFIQLYAAKFFISELGAYNSIYKFFCLWLTAVNQRFGKAIISSIGILAYGRG